MQNKAKGYLLGAFAAATYGMNPLFALPLYGAGLNPESVLLLRYLFAIPLVAAMIKLRGRDFAIPRRSIPALSLMGVLMAVSSLTLFMSYNFMDAGIASTILFVYPVMVAVIMSLLYGERTGLRTWLCIAVATAGIGLLFKGSDGATLSIAGTLLVLVSALSYAVYIVGVNRSSLRDMPTLKVTLWVVVAGAVLFALRTIPDGGPVLPDSLFLWFCAAGLAIFPTAVSFLCTTSAIHRIGSTPVAILGALEPVTALLIGVGVFGERLTLRDGIGIAMIITAVTLVIGGSAFTSHMLRFRRLFPSLRRKR